MRRVLTPVIIALLVIAEPATAQIASGGDTTLFKSDAAGVRSEPQFAARAISFGPWLADLRLTAAAIADSNVFRAASNRESDVKLTVSPTANLVGSFGADRVTLTAEADLTRHANVATENSETFALTAGGLFDFGPNASATARLRYAHEVETRGQAGSNIVNAGPAEVRRFEGAESFRAAFGRLTIALGVGYVEQRYAPLTLRSGGSIDQSFRNTRIFSLTPRANFALSPDTSFFVATGATKTKSIRRDVTLRDATGYRLLAGVRSESNGLVIGEVGVGWRRQNYKNPLLKDFGGFTYDVTLDWYPTQLVSLRLQGGQDITNSGLTTVAGIERRTTAFKVYYDPLRRLRLTFALDYDRDRYREIGVGTRSTTAALTSRYLISPRFSVSGYLRYQSKTSSDAATLPGYRAASAGFALTGSL